MSEPKSAAGNLRRNLAANAAEEKSKSSRSEPAADQPSPGDERMLLARLVAFYEIAKQAGLARDPALAGHPPFREGSERYRELEEKLREIFPGDAVRDYIQFHVEGSLTRQGKTYEDVWAEFAPPEMNKYPLPPGSIF